MPSENPILKNIWKYSKGVPYVSWNPALVEQFKTILKKIPRLEVAKLQRRIANTTGPTKRKLTKECKKTELIRNQTDQFIAYLERSFLSNTHPTLGYRNWAKFPESEDRTNNSVECVNHAYKEFVGDGDLYVGFKQTVSSTLDFICSYIEKRKVSLKKKLKSLLILTFNKNIV